MTQPVNTRSIAPTIGLYFLPGILTTLVLYGGARHIAELLGANLWMTQVALILVFLLFFQALLAWKLIRPADGLEKAYKLKALGLVRPSLKELGIALGFSLAAVAFMRVYNAYIGSSLMTYLAEIPLLALPEWHYQVTRPPEMGAGGQVLLFVVVMGANVFCEELFFRGFLFQRTEVFAGRYT